MKGPRDFPNHLSSLFKYGEDNLSKGNIQTQTEGFGYCDYPLQFNIVTIFQINVHVWFQLKIKQKYTGVENCKIVKYLIGFITIRT